MAEHGGVNDWVVLLLQVQQILEQQKQVKTSTETSSLLEAKNPRNQQTRAQQLELLKSNPSLSFAQTLLENDPANSLVMRAQRQKKRAESKAQNGSQGKPTTPSSTAVVSSPSTKTASSSLVSSRLSSNKAVGSSSLSSSAGGLSSSLSKLHMGGLTSTTSSLSSKLNLTSSSSLLSRTPGNATLASKETELALTGAPSSGLHLFKGLQFVLEIDGKVAAKRRAQLADLVKAEGGIVSHVVTKQVCKYV
jgi:hypothetical protein